MPCFQLARRVHASPCGVRGPVLAPPCILQRPFFITGPLQGVPWRVLAPHLGLRFGSPGGVPIFQPPSSSCVRYSVTLSHLLCLRCHRGSGLQRLLVRLDGRGHAQLPPFALPCSCMPSGPPSASQTSAGSVLHDLRLRLNQ